MNTSTRFLMNLTLAVQCITSIVYAQHPYTLQFFTSSDCSEESRIAYYYMPDTAVSAKKITYIMGLLRNYLISVLVKTSVALRSLRAQHTALKTALRVTQPLRMVGQ